MYNKLIGAKMWRKFSFLILVISFILVNILHAQDEKLDSLDFSIESAPGEMQSTPYFAIAGGYTGTFIFLNFDNLNKHLSDNGFGFATDAFKKPLYMSGAQGFTAIGIIPNLRVGFFGMGGSSIAEMNTTIDSVACKRSFNYSVSFNGLNIDYAIVPWKSVAFIPGVSFGWGSLTMESYQNQTGDNSWIDLKPNANAINYFNRAKATYSFIQPNLNVEFAVTTFFGLRLSAGYMWTFSFTGDYGWQYNNTSKLVDVPKSINASGLTLQFGLFMGLFNY